MEDLDPPGELLVLLYKILKYDPTRPPKCLETWIWRCHLIPRPRLCCRTVFLFPIAHRDHFDPASDFPKISIFRKIFFLLKTRLNHVLEHLEWFKAIKIFLTHEPLPWDFWSFFEKKFFYLKMCLNSILDHIKWFKTKKFFWPINTNLLIFL